MGNKKQSAHTARTCTLAGLSRYVQVLVFGKDGEGKVGFDGSMGKQWLSTSLLSRFIYLVLISLLGSAVYSFSGLGKLKKADEVECFRWILLQRVEKSSEIKSECRFKNLI